MNEDRCRWNGQNQPRTVPGRHDGDCTDEACRGCAPCPSAHCRVCNSEHTAGTCPECLAIVRDNLRSIGRLCDALPDEVEHRGVEGEAMMLLGPSTNPEARGHLEASVRSGRVPADYIEESDDLHPLFLLGSWDMLWRDALDHDEPQENVRLAAVIDYLDRTMGYMGGFEHLPFEDFAGDMGKCRTHLEAVLHDQERGVRANVPCFDCGADLERRLGKDGFEDHWTCRKCKRRYTIAEYNFALRAELEGNPA